MITDELYHHGRLNQKWGVRNGPPYPLSNSTVRENYGTKKKGGLSGYIQTQKEKKAAEKAVKEAREKAQADKKIAEEKANRETDKQKALHDGSAIEVSKYASELTNKELKDAIDRIKNLNTLDELVQKEADKGWRTVDSVMKKVGNVKDWSKTGVELWKTIDEAMKLIDNSHNKK